MLELAASAIAALSPYLPAIAQNAVRSGQNLAARALYDVIASALRRMGEQSAWEAFVHNPADPSTVTKLLAAAARHDPHLTDELDKAVQKLTYDNSSNRVDQRGAHSRGDMVGRDKKTSYGGPIAILAVVIVAVVALIAGGKALYDKVASSGLSADSTCAQFLQASESDELTAIRKVGVDEGIAGIGSPLALPAISYSCSGEPNARLGDVIAKFKGQF